MMKYVEMVFYPIRDVLITMWGFFPTLLTAFIILTFGWIIARTIRKFLTSVLKSIDFDTITGKMGLARVLRIGGVKHKPSEMVTCAVYWVLMIVVLTSTIEAFGITLASDFFDKLFVYIPHVLVGSLALIVGMLLAKVISGLVYVTAKNTDMPIPEVLRDLTKFALVIYVSILYLTEIGAVSLLQRANHSIVMLGLVFALSIAFGLAGKDIASKYLGVFDRTKK